MKIIQPRIKRIGVSVKKIAAIPGRPILGETEPDAFCGCESVMVEAYSGGLMSAMPSGYDSLATVLSDETLKLLPASKASSAARCFSYAVRPCLVIRNVVVPPRPRPALATVM